jgi:hypothetical protein
MVEGHDAVVTVVATKDDDVAQVEVPGVGLA